GNDSLGVALRKNSSMPGFIIHNQKPHAPQPGVFGLLNFLGNVSLFILFRTLYNSVNLGKGTLSTLMLLETRGIKMKKKQKSSVPNRQSVTSTSKLNPIHPNAAGIDIDSQHHFM
ncbi:hypothetical protein, partial [Nostoc sp.]|uniref:hypothetical protein n=1 Tax=Nostoc sp. TaxID=1180 RepID=UPI002FF5784E